MLNAKRIRAGLNHPFIPALILFHYFLIILKHSFHQIISNLYSILFKEPVTDLDNYVINQVSCGAAHSLAINEWGQLFTWGSNSKGQLAKDTTEAMNCVPRLVKSLATKPIVQIASGQYHSLALTNSRWLAHTSLNSRICIYSFVFVDGELYAWGANGYGQLGLGNNNQMISTPTLVKSLCGIPIAFITCGGNHSFALSK